MKNSPIFLAGFVGFVVFLLCAYTNYTKTTITMNGDEYEHVGVIEQKINGDTVYIPIYRRK